MFCGIRLKLFIFVFVLLSLATVAFSLTSIQVLNKTTRNEIIRRAETLGKSSAAAAAYSLISEDPLGIDHIVFKGKRSSNDIEYVAIVDNRRKILAHSDIQMRGTIFKESEGPIVTKSEDGTAVREGPVSSTTGYEIGTPIPFKGKVLGMIYVGLNHSVLAEARRTARLQVLWLFAATFLGAVVGVFGLSFFITRPIRELASGVDELKQGKRFQPLRVYSKDELGKLTDSFNGMRRTITDQQEELHQYTQDLEEAYVSIVKVLAMAIDARDPYTLGHSARVAAHAVMIGEKIGLSKKEIEELEIASLFHDLGKLRTPDSILMKTRPLDSLEFNLIKQHPEDGAKILGKVKSLQKYVASVRHHHEHYDGRGYPEGLGGDRIPLHSAIIAIADTFDAMTSTRPYRRALSESEALAELQKGAGKQFHPGLVEAFTSAMQERDHDPSRLPEPCSVTRVI